MILHTWRNRFIPSLFILPWLHTKLLVSFSFHLLSAFWDGSAYFNNFSIYPVTSQSDPYECIKHWPSPACIFLSSVIISLCATLSGQIHFTKLTNNSLSLSLSLSLGSNSFSTSSKISYFNQYVSSTICIASWFSDCSNWTSPKRYTQHTAWIHLRAAHFDSKTVEHHRIIRQGQARTCLTKTPLWSLKEQNLF